jgi:cytidine deaminase
MISSCLEEHLLDLVSHPFKETKHYAIFLPRKAKSIRSRIVIGECNPTTHMGLPSIHAEHAALIKLIKFKNRPQNLDLLVVRFSKGGKLGESRPCLNCLKKLEYTAEKHGINICSVHYSTCKGLIESETLRDMRLSSKTYISGGFRSAATWR